LSHRSSALRRSSDRLPSPPGHHLVLIPRRCLGAWGIAKSATAATDSPATCRGTPPAVALRVRVIVVRPRMTQRTYKSQRAIRCRRMTDRQEGRVTATGGGPSTAPIASLKPCGRHRVAAIAPCDHVPCRPAVPSGGYGRDPSGLAGWSQMVSLASASMQASCRARFRARCSSAADQIGRGASGAPRARTAATTSGGPSPTRSVRRTMGSRLAGVGRHVCGRLSHGQGARRMSRSKAKVLAGRPVIGSGSRPRPPCSSPRSRLM